MNEQFLYEVEIAWTVISEYPSNNPASYISGGHSPHSHRGVSTVAIVVPKTGLELISATVARIMDEDHGADTDTADRLIRKEWVINRVEFLRKVRL